MPFDNTCQIRRALITDQGRAQLDLKADNGDFDWSWFLSSTEQAREVFAAALTAIATDKKIHCLINDPVQAWEQVVKFGVVK